MTGKTFSRLRTQVLATALAVTMGAAGPALAGDSNGNFQIKVGISGVWTDDETNSLVTSAGVDLLAAGASASTDDMTLPTLTLTYFFNRNVAVELFCCFGQTSIVGEGLISGQGEIAETWMFPPILTLQYHFDGLGPLRPYVGAGVEWIHYFDTKPGSNGLGAVAVDLDDSFGFALQAGVDFDLGGGWSLGLDVKKVWEDTDVTWRFADGSRITAEHDIDPLIATANLGYRFNIEDLLGRREAAPLK
ncbi:OmpW family outer membrane protein [uncultured Hyphomicrobium sp.]|uniref:OmpW/AlkL family protein n=1 Tax=uncultured Hyphomicrobium sp. TaxID=194373 RepID=UPI0025FD78B9|nr:OmpW family outer membrane protein [uncultured Hyphomicrobium sp.]